MRARLAQGDVDLEKMLGEIKHAKEETARELSRAQAERESAERAATGARRKLAEIEKSQGDILQRARAEANAEVEAARSELSRLRQEWHQVALTREFIERAEEELEDVGELIESEPPSSIEPVATSLTKRERIEVGDRVHIQSLDQYGEVIAVGEDGLDVQIGSFRAHLSVDQVQLEAKAAQAAANQVTQSMVVLPIGESPGMEVHLRGMRAEEALDKLDKYLDRAYRAGLPYVRIVHGKGTGTLRRLVREQLSANPLVVSFQTAEPQDGGEGVTVARMVSR